MMRLETRLNGAAIAAIMLSGCLTSFEVDESLDRQNVEDAGGGSGDGGGGTGGSGGSGGGSASCGNGVLDEGELCDGDALAGSTCESATLGALPAGTLQCSPDCTFDTRGCGGGVITTTLDGGGGMVGMGGTTGLFDAGFGADASIRDAARDSSTIREAGYSSTIRDAGYAYDVAIESGDR